MTDDDFDSTDRERLSDLVQEMGQAAGPASPEAYERVLAQWFADD